MTLSLRYAAQSDVGLLRDGNEDSGYAGPRMLAVADGMGGQAAGEVASAVVVAVLADLDHDVPGSELLDTLARAVDQANEQLGAMMDEDPSLEGMGTTLTALYFTGTRLGVVHVGDSRAYLVRNGELNQITHDHTFVQTLVDEGRITVEQAGHHPHRSLLMRALDGRGRVDFDLSVREVHPGDRYLVCSDGLSGVVSHETIEETLCAARTPDEAADTLVALALRAGGPDNITCIVADIVGNGPPPPSAVPQIVGAAAERSSNRRIAPDTPAVRAAAALSDANDAADRDDPITGPGRGRRWARRFVITVLALGILGAAGWLGYTWTQQQYYVGAAGEQVAIYRGLPEPILGVELSSVYEQATVPLDDLRAFSRREVEGTIEANNLDHARIIVERLEAEAEECRALRTAAELARRQQQTQPPPITEPTPGATAVPTPGATPTPTPSPTPTVPPPVDPCGQQVG